MASEIEEGDFQYDVPLAYDPLVPACSPLAHGFDTSLDEAFKAQLYPDPMGVSGGIAPPPMHPTALEVQARLQQAHTQALAQVKQMVNANPLAQHAQGNWQSTAAQQWMSQQASGMLGGAGASWQQAANHLVHVIPIQEVGREKIRQLTDQLPMRVMEGIGYIRLYEDPLRFVVTYKNGHELIIHDVDKFPAPDHVSRILLESS